MDTPRRARFAACASATVVAGLLAATVSAAPQAGAALIRVGLTVRGATTGLAAGAIVVLTAKAKLPAGGRLQIRRRSPSSRVWHLIVECASSPCTTVWGETREASVAFAARAIRRRHGSSGRIEAVVGTSRAVAVAWHALPPGPPAPPPAPPPVPGPAAAALAGTYCGTTGQGRSVCVEVTAGGAAVTSFQSDVTVDCPTLYHVELRPSFYDVVPVRSDLGFSHSYTDTLAGGFSTSRLVVGYTIDGRLDTAGNVSGTITVASVSWEQNGKHVYCPGTSVGWRAKRVS